MRKLIATLILVCGLSCFAQTDNTLSVKNFPGSTVGIKLTAAMNSCNPNTQIPCILILDPSLAVWPSGTIPSLCSQCSLVDYRTGFPSGGGGFTPSGDLSGSGTHQVVSGLLGQPLPTLVTGYPNYVVGTGWQFSTPSGSLPAVAQAGQTPVATGVAGATTYGASGYPTAGNVLTAALLQPYTPYTTVASTCAAITDTNAKAACSALDTATLNLQSAAQNSGLVSSTANPLTGLFTILWNAAPTPTAGTSTIPSVIGTHVLTLSSGSLLVPVTTGGQDTLYEQTVGPCANGPAFKTTCQSGLANQNTSLTLTDTTSTSDATCYNTDCTILFVARNQTPNQWATTGSLFSNSGRLSKNLEWQIYPQASSTIAAQVGMWNNGTSAWITSNCPAYAQYRSASTLIPSVQAFPGGNLPAKTYIWLVYNHTAGTFACAINDGTLGSSVAVALTATSVGTVTTPAGGVGWEEIAYSPTQISQANRSAYYNLGASQHAPNYTDPAFAQLTHYQFQNSDLWDVSSPIQYTNGGLFGNTPYRMLWSQAHARLVTNEPWIAFDFAPGYGPFGGSQATMTAKVDGVLYATDWAYTLNGHQIFRVQLDGNTHTVDLIEGADQMNGVTPFSSATLYAGIGGEFLDGYYAPRGNYTTTVSPYGPVTSVSLAGAGTGQVYGIYNINSANCPNPATIQVTVSTGGTAAAPVLLNAGSHCSNPTFTMPTTTGTPATFTASTGVTTTVWIADSIYSGILTNDSSTDSAVAIERSGQLLPSPTTDSFGDTNTALVGAGFIKLWDDCPTQTACNTWYQSQVAALTGVANVVMVRGANDFGYGCSLSPLEGLSGWNATLGYFLTAVRTYTPTAKVWMQAILPTGAESSYDGCSSSTNTRATYRTAEQTACSAYTGSGTCVYVDTTNAANGWPAQANTGDFNTDTVHPTSQGHVKVCAGWKTVTGSAYPTTCKNPI